MGPDWVAVTVITISGKDRSAIGLAGQHGTAYMHSTVTGRFITSDYYMPDYPGWWKAFYEGKPQDRYFGKSWDPLLPEEAYARFAWWSFTSTMYRWRRLNPRQGILRCHDVDAVG